MSQYLTNSMGFGKFVMIVTITNEVAHQRPKKLSTAAQDLLAAYEKTANNLARSLEDRIRQLTLGLPIPFLLYHGPAPVTALLGEAVEHTTPLERVLVDGVPHTVQVRHLEECRHYCFSVVGAILVDVGWQVRHVKQPLLIPETEGSRYTGVVHKITPYGPGPGVRHHRRGFYFS